MEIREYRSEDLPALAMLFFYTVRRVNIRDYSPEQVGAWATGTIDMDAWHKSLSSHSSLVAVKDGVIVGFGDIDQSGYLDRLYVHYAFQRQGIATALCDRLEASVTSREITVHASITAIPFFAKRGYRFIEVQKVERNGVCMENNVMKMCR